MNREERRQLAMRMRRGIATKEEIEAFAKRQQGGGGRGGGYAAGGSAYYLLPSGTVTRTPQKGAVLLRRAQRRALVGIRRWREGSRTPSRIEMEWTTEKIALLGKQHR